MIFDLAEFNWRTQALDHLYSKKKFYAQELKLAVIDVSISFKKTTLHHFRLRDSAKQEEFSILNTFTKAFGLALSNVENAQVRVKGIAMESVYDTMNGIGKKLTQHCKDELLKSLPMFLGSIQIIGNPVELFNSLGTGLVDFIEKPIEGFVQGPLEGGMGFIRGTESLVKNTIVGTVSTLNRFTTTVADGISALAMVNLSF